MKILDMGHICAGALICDLFNGIEGRGIANSSQLIFQDVVNESGWNEPGMDWHVGPKDLSYGAVIHTVGEMLLKHILRSFLRVKCLAPFIAPEIIQQIVRAGHCKEHRLCWGNNEG